MSSAQIPAPVAALLARGVQLKCPATIELDPALQPERIAPGVVVHAGCRLRGAETSIGPGCVLGAEAPVTLDNCQLGADVQLHGGFFSGATFLDGVQMGSAAHVRPGTLLEEHVTAGHAVGFKQTLLMPYVTTGSLINFCDILMAGGSGSATHSEVGSSYVHFNFTPHRDKATASLVGDVPRGVFLDQPPIFLGGQGGLVGPVRIGYGTLIPAGQIWRKDAEAGGQVLWAAASANPTGPMPCQMEMYRDLRRVVRNNLIYLGNLRAWQAWYRTIRARHLAGDPFQTACLRGAQRQLASAVDERLKRLSELADKMEKSATLLRAQPDGAVREEWIKQQDDFRQRWPDLGARFMKAPPDSVGEAARETFLNAVEAIPSSLPYIEMLRQLSPDARRDGTIWLQAIVDAVLDQGRDLKALNA